MKTFQFLAIFMLLSGIFFEVGTKKLTPGAEDFIFWLAGILAAVSIFEKKEV